MTTTEPPYVLGDGTALHAAHPDTFEIPDPHQIEALAPGDYVKLIFEIPEPDYESGPGAERMWVEITTAGDGHYTGTLANPPCFMPLEYGDPVEFTSAAIIATQPAQGDAMAVKFHSEGK